MDNTRDGYIFLARKIISSDIFSKPPLYLKVWIYLLSRAQHKDYKGLKRGQLYTSIPEIREATAWKVGYRTEMPTKDQIFQVLDWLRSESEGGHESNAKATMITTTKATHGMLVTICNYDLYQTSATYESNDGGNDEKVTKPLREQRQPDNINKNVKNDKNDKNNKKNNGGKPKKRVYADDDPNKILARTLLKVIRKNHDIKEPDLDKWANTIRLMIENDKRPGKDVQDLIVWSSEDRFWYKQILSADSLRKHYDKMMAQKNDKYKGGGRRLESEGFNDYSDLPI